MVFQTNEAIKDMILGPGKWAFFCIVQTINWSIKKIISDDLKMKKSLPAPLSVDNMRGALTKLQMNYLVFVILNQLLFSENLCYFAFCGLKRSVVPF